MKSAWTNATWLCALLGCGMAAPGHAVQAHYTGAAFDAGSAELRYREEHWLYDDQGVQARLVVYRCPNGQAFARKRLRYAGTPWAPAFELLDNRDGYTEGARPTQGAWQVYVKRNAQSAMETATLPDQDDTVVDAGFDAYIRGHWAALAGGQALTAAFVVPGRLGYLRVKLQPLATSVRDGLAVRQFRLSLDSWLGVIAPNISLIYAEADRRLLEFTGPSNLRDARGQRQRVRIEFAVPDPAAPTPGQIHAAESEALVSRCPP